MPSTFPEYYALLSVEKNANTEEIRQAYKRESLRYSLKHAPPLVKALTSTPRTHPDRLPNASPVEKKVHIQPCNVI
jgi:preprotein translocase subunit Sec63